MVSSCAFARLSTAIAKKTFRRVSGEQRNSGETNLPADEYTREKNVYGKAYLVVAGYSFTRTRTNFAEKLF